MDPPVRDRSSAIANQLIEEIFEKLKTTHYHHLTTPHQIGWRIWATLIASKPSHSHDQLILDSPPNHVVVMFRSVATSEAELLANAQKGLRVARNVNGIQREALRSIKERVRHLQSTIDVCQREAVDLLTYVELLEQQAEREASLLQDMKGAVDTEESSFSTESAAMVTDCDDIDHME